MLDASGYGTLGCQMENLVEKLALNEFVNEPFLGYTAAMDIDLSEGGFPELFKGTDFVLRASA